MHHLRLKSESRLKWTVPQMSIIIIYNSAWSILIQSIRIKLSGDNLTQETQKEDPFTSLHKIKANLTHWAKFKILWNGALLHLIGKLSTTVWIEY